jgi:hypothetical protein
MFGRPPQCNVVEEPDESTNESEIRRRSPPRQTTFHRKAGDANPASPEASNSSFLPKKIPILKWLEINQSNPL